MGSSPETQRELDSEGRDELKVFWTSLETFKPPPVPTDAQIDILITQPEDMDWSGLPVHGAAGLELGLIKAYALPWNMRSAR